MRASSPLVQVPVLVGATCVFARRESMGAGEGPPPLPRTSSSMSASGESMDAQLSQGAAAKRKGRFQIVDVPLDPKARVARSSSLAAFPDNRRSIESSAASPTGPSMSLLLPTLRVRHCSGAPPVQHPPLAAVPSSAAVPPGEVYVCQPALEEVRV